MRQRSRASESSTEMAAAASGGSGLHTPGGPLAANSRRGLPAREGYLHSSRSYDHLDASCQVDISYEVISYDSDTEMGRRRPELTRNKRGTPVYSKEDIREQYCINQKEVHVLERITTRSILNCFSERNPSPCKKQNLLTSCYKRKRKPDCPEDSARPLPRPKKTWQGSESDYDEEFFRRRPRVFCYTDPKRYTWTEGELARGRLRPYTPDAGRRPAQPPAATRGDRAAVDGAADGRRRNGSADDRLVLTQPSSPDLVSARWRHASHDQGLDGRSQKHVSFEQNIFRSQTMSSIDDTANGGNPHHPGLPTRNLNRSQERLLDGRRTPDYMDESCNLFGPFLTKALLQEKMKRSSMRTQSTQTDVNASPESAPPSYLSLSPRTMHKRLRSQEAQAQPRARPHRPLTKSHSEVGGRPGSLRRRSPPPDEPALSRAVSSPLDVHAPSQRSPSPQEIMIDYKPCERPYPLQKTLSEGEILLDRRARERLTTGCVDVNLSRLGAPRETVIEKLTVSESDLLEPSGGRLRALEQLQHAAAEVPPPPPPRDYDDDEFHENLIENLLSEAVPRAESPSSDSEAGGEREAVSPPRSTLTLTRDSLSESQETVLHVASDTPLPLPLPSDSEASTPAAQPPFPPPSPPLPPPPAPPPLESGSGSDSGSVAASGAAAVENGARSSASGSVPSLAREEALVLRQLDAISSELDNRLASPEELSRLSPPPPPPPPPLPPPPLEGWKDASPALSYVSSVSEGDEEKRMDKFLRSINDGFESDVAAAAERRAGGRLRPTPPPAAEEGAGQRRAAAGYTASGLPPSDAAADGIRPPSRVESLSSVSSAVGSEASWRREASDASGMSDAAGRRQTPVKRYSRFFEEDAAGQLVEVEKPSVPTRSPDRVRGAARRQLSKQFSVDEPERGARSLSLHLAGPVQPGGRTRRRGEDVTSTCTKEVHSDLPEEPAESAAENATAHTEQPAKPEERWTKRGVGVSSGMVRSPAMHDGFSAAEWSIVRTPQTPDKVQPAGDAAPECNDADTPRRREKKHKKRSKERAVNGAREDSGSRSRERAGGRRHAKQRSPKRRSTASEPAAEESAPPAREPVNSSSDLRPDAGRTPAALLSTGSARSVGRSVSPGSDSVFTVDGSPERPGGQRATRLDAVSLSPAEHRAQCVSCGEQLRTPEAARSRSVSADGWAAAEPAAEEARGPRERSRSGKSSSSERPGPSKAGQTLEVNGSAVVQGANPVNELLPPVEAQEQPVVTQKEHLAENTTVEQQSVKKRKRDKRRPAAATERPLEAAPKDQSGTAPINPLPQTCHAPAGEPKAAAAAAGSVANHRPAQPQLGDAAAAVRERQPSRSSGRRRRGDRADRGASEERVLETPPRPVEPFRARSEERCPEDWKQQASPRTSQDSLSRPTDAATQCALSLRDLPEDESGLYTGHFPAARWLFIGTDEELRVWRRAPRQLTDTEEQGVPPLHRSPSAESTESEQEFRRRYQAISHRMVHRKSSGHMFKQMEHKTFAGDKTVAMQKCSGEFGFRIHGSRPVVVSAIEPGTPAQLSGLEVGDIIVAINGSRVLESSHGDVVRIAHAASDELRLEVVSTSSLLPAVPQSWSCVRQGWLWRRSSSSGAWCRRWAVLKPDALLFLFKRAEDVHPVSGISLADGSVRTNVDGDREMAFAVECAGAETVTLAAESEEEYGAWLETLRNAIEESASEGGAWQAAVRLNAAGPAAKIPSPDCSGFLSRLGFKWRCWTRLYCVLKDGVLYFYRTDSDVAAFGSVYLHGYRVQSSSVGGGRRPSFEVCPPLSRLRHYYFVADSDNDRKRWLAALEYSIDRWVKVAA